MKDIPNPHAVNVPQKTYRRNGIEIDVRHYAPRPVREVNEQGKALFNKLIREGLITRANAGVTLLLDRVGSLDFPYGRSTLDMCMAAAIQKGHMRCVEELELKGARVDQAVLGRPLLFFIVERFNAQTMWDKFERLMEAQGRNMKNQLRAENGETLLHAACKSKRLWNVERAYELMKRHGADMNATSTYGSPLHAAVSLCTPFKVDTPDVAFAGKGALEFLLEKGLDTSVTDQGKRSVMHYAATAGNYDAVVTLLKVVPWQAYSRDNFGNYPCLEACKKRHWGTMKLLVYAINIPSHQKEILMMEHDAKPKVKAMIAPAIRAMKRKATKPWEIK